MQKDVHDSLDSADALTEREMEILGLLAKGWSDRKIAQHLILALETVKWYNKRVYSKLAVKNRTEAVSRANELGLFQMDSAESSVAETTIPRHNLPAATTPFVGREQELDDIVKLLSDDNIRLVTLLAVGGMGKTRLALEVAKSQIPNFENGVCFIPLAGLRDIEHIIPTIATGLNVQLSSSSNPTAELENFLANKEILLVLDNFEHLLDGANLITTLLESAPGIKIIVTSRERLNLRGETVYTPGGMILPTGKTVDAILNASAIQFFIQRVEMMRANITVSDDDLPYLVQICRQVRGMPLGIELAASLMEMLSAKEIAGEIEQNLDILATEMRDMPARLRSIRAVFDYSWSTLSENGRDVYMRLAVFRDGFSREAAQTVAGAGLRMLMTFANKALLQYDSDSGRYIMHELLRQYAEEKLEASGQANRNHQAHMRFYSNLMAECERGIKHQAQLEALNQIELDFENIRAFWQEAIQQNDFDAINQSLEALYWFCNMRGRVPDGEALFQQAREQLIKPENSHPIQARLLLRFNASGEDYRNQIENSLSIARQENRPDRIAFALWMLGVNCYVSRDFERAVTVLEEAIELFQTLDDDFYMIECLHLLGISKRFLGQNAMLIERLLRELSRKTGNKFALGRALGSQGLLAVYDGNDEHAKSYLQEAIEIRGELEDRAGVAMSLTSLGQVAFFNGDFENAKRFARKAEELAIEINARFPLNSVRVLFSWMANVEEDYHRAKALSLQVQAEMTNPNMLFPAWLSLAMASCGLEDYAEAIDNMQAIFRSNSPWHTAKGLFSCLPVLVILYAKQGELEKAVKVLAFIFSHPDSPVAWIEQWTLLQRWQTHLEMELGEDYQIAWEAGTALELEKVIEDWLSENSS